MNISTYAAIDIGSNAVRLLINNIYETTDSVTFNKASLVRVPIRLGQDVFTDGKISEHSKERLAQAMQAYKLLMDIYNVQKFRAFATSAMRESQNATDVIDYVKNVSGIEIEVISGEEEAEIIFSSELKNYIESNEFYLFIDVGGGSTEISLLNKGKVINSQSFPIGTVRLLDGKVNEEYLFETIKPWVKNITRDLSVEAVGSGGNINYIFKNSEKKEGKSLTVSYLVNQYKILKELTYNERIEKYNMKPDRADVIVPALLIYSSVMKFANAKQIFVPKIGAADGMINLMYKRSKEKK
ncbi:exopolyphosphatase [Apibacter muscae]|uniref:Ppx/GppA phosphatase family protein n=1 Tax=Apibacter muscae TaxID=2509004 RepID=UPI0011AC4123|nr:ethanolamine ammonia-lyase reactivating factor EutA [Apibacter muscae]TWP27919.1 exopolyphosphatase [Apibacter muscae]